VTLILDEGLLTKAGELFSRAGRGSEKEGLDKVGEGRKEKKEKRGAL